MAKPYRLELDDAQKAELEKAVRRHAKPYVRERAAAILKVAAGESMRQVALHELLEVHDPQTLRVWIDRYLSQGLAGLMVRPGRGRKPAFFPPGRRGG